MFSRAKEGDRAWSYRFGWGVISKVKEGYTHPIHFQIPGHEVRFYSIDGYQDVDYERPTLFWDEVHFDPPKRPRPIPPVDTKVLVRKSSLPGVTHKRYLHSAALGGIWTFPDGRDSWSSKGGREYWDIWEVYGDD